MTQIRVKLKPSKKLGLEGVTFVQMDGCIIVQYFAAEKNISILLIRHLVLQVFTLAKSSDSCSVFKRHDMSKK